MTDQRTCSIEGCDGKLYGRGWCSKHYQRARRNGGDPLANGRHRKGRGGWFEKVPVEDRFWSHVNFLTPTGCWIYDIGDNTATGYATTSVNGKTVRAHRWAWEHFNGPIPEGLTIDHLCRTRTCMNPNHMELVTPSENSRRCQAALRAERAAALAVN